MTSKLRKYFDVLLSINCLQTFYLYLRIKKPRSSSIRVLNKSIISIDETAEIEMDESSWLEINRQDYAHDRGLVCRLLMEERSLLHIGGGIQWLKNTTITIHKGAVLNIGGKTYLNGASVECSGRISIGSHCSIAEGVKIMDNSWHSVSSSGIVSEKIKPVIIGNHVWIATNVIVLPGVTIGDGAAIAAGAVVSRDIPARCLAAGVPARVIKENIEWD